MGTRMWQHVGLLATLCVAGCSCNEDAVSGTLGPDGGGLDGGQDGGTADAGPKQDPGPRTASGALDFSCGTLCLKDSVGPAGTAAFDVDMDPSERVSLDDDGALVLNREAGPSGPSVIWIADQGSPHTVLKVDTETLQQLARYRVGPDGEEDPSRTAVDGDGNVYVGNRGGEAATWQGKDLTSVTKVMNVGCPDQDGDGMVTTSTGPNDVLPWGEDECIVWHVPFPHDVRAIAAQDVPAQVIQAPDGDMLIPAEHYVWVSGMNGTYSPSNGQRATLRKLDARTGMTVLELEAYPAYGMALDGRGNLWLDRGEPGGGVQRIDTTQCVDMVSCDVDYCENSCNETDCTDQNDGCVKQLITGLPGGPGYGITVDKKQRVWIGGSGDQVLKRYDQLAPANQRFQSGLIPNVHGIAADGEGFVWGAYRGNGFDHPSGVRLERGVVRIDAETMDAVTAAPGDAKGMALDKQGKIWAISNNNYATVVVPGPTLQDNAASQPIDDLTNPYTYSDMTGQQTRLASNDPGFYTRLIEGCDGASTEWLELAWDADVPANTKLRFSVRSADTIADLAAQTWINLAVVPPDVSPLMLPSSIDARYLEVEVQLVAGDPNDALLTPRVQGFGASYECDLLQ